MYDLIIIGAGPSGLSAALYALRANKKVLVLEEKAYGGQILNASNIENYPGISNISGFDFASNLYKQVMDLGCEIKYEKVIKINEDKTVITKLSKYESKSIIIATGVKNKKINLKNEEKFVGKGISYCAVCDGNFYKDKIVGIVGGGNTALRNALYLSNLAEKVYLINRKNIFKGELRLVEELKNKSNIEIILNTKVKKINGDDFLSGVEVEDNSKNRKIIELSGLFIAIGQEPDNEIFSNILKLDKKGYIISDGVKTDKKGIFVVGDARKKKVRQLVTAISDGAIAATLAIEGL